MAHYAQIEENSNKVIRVIVLPNYLFFAPNPDNIIIDLPLEKEEQIANNYISNVLKLKGIWKKTSYNTKLGSHINGKMPLRKNYAGIGYVYDFARDAFIPPKKYQSWLLDEQTCTWKAPIQKPNDGKIYIWDENILNWKEVQ